MTHRPGGGCIIFALIVMPESPRIQVYYCLEERLLSENEFQVLQNALPEPVRSAIEAYSDAESRQLRLISKSLLQFALREKGFEKAASLEHYAHRSGEKPFLKNFPQHFSIAHSAHLSACGLSDCPVGIDVETENDYAPDLLEPHFDRGTWQRIVRSLNPQREAVSAWTRREAACKAAGIPVYDFDIAQPQSESGCIRCDGSVFYLVPLALPQPYLGSAAASVPHSDVTMRSVSIDELIGCARSPR